MHAGDLLAQIDPRTYQASLDSALAKKAQDQAQLANARLDLTRYTALAEKNYVARQQLDTTRNLVNQLDAAVQGDEASIENARVMLGYTTIKSPIEGRAGIRQVDVGNIVHASDSSGIVVVTQVHPISVLFSLPEDSVTRILQAMNAAPLKVVALSRDGKKQLDEGSLEVIDNQIDQTTGMVRLKATLPNKKGLLWPGQFVNARLQVSTLPLALTIPADAVKHGPEGAFAFVVKPDSTVDIRRLELGETSEGKAVVQSGIAEGEMVVTEGQYRLEQGTRVEMKTAAEPTTSTSKPE
jgi:multidrug efflux system membrane fusion protein